MMTYQALEILYPIDCERMAECLEIEGEENICLGDEEEYCINIMTFVEGVQWSLSSNLTLVEDPGTGCIIVQGSQLGDGRIEATI